MRTLKDFQFDGKAVLQSVLEASEYKSILQAIASLTLFSHPRTVEQTNYQNLFRVIRCNSMSQRGSYSDLADNFRVMLDDNMAAIEAFTWSNKIKRPPDCQFNHIWSDSKNVSLYTNLANICVSPSFLAKLTDTDKAVCELLKFRSYQLYNGFSPDGIKINKPEGYNNLIWAEPLPPIENLEDCLRNEMKRKRSNRTVRSAKEIGWLFSSFIPDPNI
jgi:hypothetical protein